MNLSIKNTEVLNQYKSNSQRIRVMSEKWFSNEMFCPCCLNKKINIYPNNKKVSDFFCESCNNDFQLKSSKTEFSKKVVDGEYNTMINAVSKNISPNFFMMNYSANEWYVKNLFLIPKFFINSSIIEKRNPLSDNARRAGWTGCNILLSNLPEEGKISIIKNGKELEKNIINQNWKKMFFLNLKKPEIRGWTSDVLKCVNEIRKNKFNLSDIYRFEDYLKELHPKNNNIQAKIRQQLQILRDNKIIKFKERGVYEVIE